MKEKYGGEKKAMNPEDLLVQVLPPTITIKYYIPSNWFRLPEDEKKNMNGSLGVT